MASRRSRVVITALTLLSESISIYATTLLHGEKLKESKHPPILVTFVSPYHLLKSPVVERCEAEHYQLQTPVVLRFQEVLIF